MVKSSGPAISNAVSGPWRRHARRARVAKAADHRGLAVGVGDRGERAGAPVPRPAPRPRQPDERDVAGRASSGAAAGSRRHSLASGEARSVSARGPPGRGSCTAPRHRPCPWSGCRPRRRRPPARRARRPSTWTCTMLLPRTLPVDGHRPSGSTWTNGSSAYAFSHTARTLGAASAPRRPAARAGGEDAARHRRQRRRERDRDRLRRLPAAVRFCSISGVCRCTPPTPYGDIAPMTSAPSRCGLSDLPAPEVPEAATTTTSRDRARRRRSPGARARDTAVG